MLNDKYTPKGKEDFISELSKEFPDLDEDTIEKLANKELKHQENFGGVLKQKKWRSASAKNAKSLLKKEKEKSTEKTKGSKKEEVKKPLISSDDKAYLFSGGATDGVRMKRTEVRLLEKAMKVDETDSYEKALKGKTYASFKATNDALITRRGSVLGASRGGSTASKGSVEAEVVDEFLKDLPSGLAGQKKKE